MKCIVRSKRGSPTLDVGDEVLDAAAEVTVVVDRVGVVAAAHQVEITPVDAAAVAVDDVADLLLVGQAGEAVGAHQPG